MTQALLAGAGAIYCGLGVLHAVLTGARQTRALSPVETGLRAAMGSAHVRLHPDLRLWDAWVGFNWSHSLGLLVFGLAILLFAGDLSPLHRTRVGPLVGIVAIAGIYVAMSVRYWFWVPALATAVAAALASSALLVRLLD